MRRTVVTKRVFCTLSCFCYCTLGVAAKPLGQAVFELCTIFSCAVLLYVEYAILCGNSLNRDHYQHFVGQLRVYNCVLSVIERTLTV